MQKMIIAWILFTAIILTSDCVDIEKKPSETAPTPNSQPAGDLPVNVSVNNAETPAGAVRLEYYDGKFLGPV